MDQVEALVAGMARDSVTACLAKDCDDSIQRGEMWCREHAGQLPISVRARLIALTEDGLGGLGELVDEVEKARGYLVEKEAWEDVRG